MFSTLLTFLSPAKILRGIRYKKEQRRYDRSQFDLELYLYSRILRNGMLHYGYFEEENIEARDISIGMMETAQEKYATLILDELIGFEGRVLDAGCGMGGLTGMMLSKEIAVEALTPNKNQIAHVKQQFPDLTTHHCKFEDLNTAESYSAVVHSESLQYIDLQKAFAKTEEILDKNGHWIITDYFRLQDEGINNSGHLHADFLKAVEVYGWTIEKEMDITNNILPTLRLIWLYAERFLKPVKHFALEKFRFKKPWLFFMTADLHDQLDTKIEKELSSVDPELFKTEKRYMLYVLKRKE